VGMVVSITFVMFLSIDACVDLCYIIRHLVPKNSVNFLKIYYITLSLRS
jgi:hypothetical protein